MQIKRIRSVTNILGRHSSKLANFKNASDKQRAILMYHGVSNSHAYNCVLKGQFEKQLEWVSAHYEIIALSDLVLRLREQTPIERDQLAVTFDDGYLNFMESALPVLREREIPATLFVPAAKVGGVNDWDAGQPGYEELKLMDFSQLRSLPGDLIEIGSHGLHHRRLDNLSTEELTEELSGSCRLLEQKLQREIRLLSLPYGIHCDRHRRAGEETVAEHTYQAVCSSLWGRFNRIEDLYALRRIGVWLEDTLADFARKMTGYYDWLTVKETFGSRLRKSWLNKKERA